jgi:heptosyltransferase-2
MSRQILIIKLGALGDVIRTTPVLRKLGGEITWLTSTLALPLLEDNPRISVLTAVDAPGFVLDRRFDLVINLEDDVPSAELASRVAAGRIVGPYFHGSSMTYDTASSEWFDMSLSSRYGREKADELKMRNRKTYQEMVFSALGEAFAGEDPVLNLPLRKTTEAGLVGIEDRAGGTWPSKRWNRYPELAVRLETLGYRTKFFRQRESVIEYIDDINECEFVICGDTLAMHIALALGKSVVSLFTCTSPYEVYGYGRLSKVVSPLLEQYFYRREYSSEPADAITTPTVEACFRSIAGYLSAQPIGRRGRDQI